MASNESHAIRNTVIGGLIVAAIIGAVGAFARSSAERAFTWASALVVSGWRWLNDSHAVPGWLMVLSLPFILFALLRLVRALRRPDPPHLSYTEDYIRGAKWRWQWFNSGVINVAGFCSRCDTRLVYSEWYDRTDFICENCNNSLVWSCQGGRLDYALAHISREIERKVRAGEFRNAQPDRGAKR